MTKIKELCNDDSALIRSIMTDIVNGQPDMEMVATAPDPLIGRDLIKRFNPDVLTLDVEMPRMDGLDFLERLMRLRPMPVVMISSLTQRGSEITLHALELGAVDFVNKPHMALKEGMLQYAELIEEKIHIASRACIHRLTREPSAVIPLSGPRVRSEKIIAIGASTGGTEALRQTLLPLPPSSPGIVITQHMPPGLTHSFAQRLDGLCRISVKEAEDGERVLPGHAYIAPGNRHMELVRSGANYHVRISDGEPVNRHRPSVDVLFRSVATSAGKNAVGVILTGMGSDGAKGLLEMHNAGAHTLAQSEKSCVVFGMPREAIALNPDIEVVDLCDMSQQMLNSVVGQARRI